jgi:hypothetical protein
MFKLKVAPVAEMLLREAVKLRTVFALILQLIKIKLAFIMSL